MARWVECSPMVWETWVHVIPITFKIVLDTSLLNTQQYKVRIKGKMEQSRERISTPPRPRCCNCWKGSLLFILGYGRQLYFYNYLLTLMVQSDWYYKSRSVGVTSDVGLITDRRLFRAVSLLLFLLLILLRRI